MSKRTPGNAVLFSAAASRIPTPRPGSLRQTGATKPYDSGLSLMRPAIQLEYSPRRRKPSANIDLLDGLTSLFKFQHTQGRSVGRQRDSAWFNYNSQQIRGDELYSQKKHMKPRGKNGLHFRISAREVLGTRTRNNGQPLFPNSLYSQVS